MSRGSIAISAQGARSSVTRLYAESPLRLLHASKQREAAWIYQTNLGGGLVGGDTIALDVDAGANTRTLLATQASTKIYGGKPSAQHLHARLGDDSFLAVISDPLVCFRDASYAQSLRFELAPNATLVVLDWLTCGRRAFGERWCFARYDCTATLMRDGQTVIAERTLLEGDDLEERMRRFDVIGFLWLCGPRVTASLDSSRSLQAATSRLADDLTLIRFCAEDIGIAQQGLTSALSCLRAPLGEHPWLRRH